jgi:soluble lytic murein transglycosylase
MTTPPMAPAPALPPPDPSLFDPARVTLILDDGRLAAVKAHVDREAYAKAAQELGALIAASPALSPEDRRAFLYQLGRLRALGGDPAGAAKAFQDSAAFAWALSDYAHLSAAQWLVGVGQFDKALAEVQAIGPDLANTGAVDLVVADALHGKNDVDGAAVRWRAYLGRDKRPPQWVTVALRFAGALLNRPSEAHAEEAIRLARRVIEESPGGAGAGSAKDIEKQALETLPHARRKDIDKLTSDELLARAKNLAGSQQSREAVLVTDKLLRMSRTKKSGEFACDTWLTRSDAILKMKKRPEAADAYKDAIDRCDGQPRRVEALFWGARASAQAGRHLEAVARFAQLEKEFPSHRLADDARLRGARASLEAGDEAKFAQMLGRIADDYPDGDLTNDGLFELALNHIGKKDWAGAIVTLERALARAPRERAYFAAGRLPYFLARAHIETGATQQGLTELAAVIRDYPLTYYMALAYARLAERDRPAADRAVTEAAAREPAGAFTIPRGPWADTPAFGRAVELIRQGDAKLARSELDRLGVSARTAPVPLLWASAFLLGRAGAITVSHSLLRSGMNTHKPQGTELIDWLDHYPTGRWRAAWEVAYPRPFAAIVATEAKRQSLPEAWAYAIMREESAFDARVVSVANAFGLMQLIPPTAKRMAQPLGLPWDEDSLKRPEVNIALGCRYLAVLRGQFSDSPLLAIPGYNAGGGAPKKWLGERPTEDFDLWVEKIPYDETKSYTKRVITSMAAYEFLYARDLPSEARSTPLAASPSARAAAAPVP